MKIENLAFWGKKRSFLLKKFARPCVYKKLFVFLHSQFVFMDEQIRHTGVVMNVEGELAHVQIVQTSACSACKVRSMCMSSESQQKEMDCVMLEPMKVGDKVEVEVREKLAWKAVLLAYILPFIVMMGVIAGLDFATEWSEAVVGTLSLCGIAVYYIGLSFFKDRLQKQFVFTARKL